MKKQQLSAIFVSLGKKESGTICRFLLGYLGIGRQKRKKKFWNA